MSRNHAVRMAVLLVIALAFALTPSAALAATNPTVTGHATGSDGYAIPGATVVVNLLSKGVYRYQTTLSTDAQGSWSYTARAGAYRFDFSAPSADAKSVMATTLKGTDSVLDVTLESHGAISGTISDGSTGVGLGGTTVEFYLQTGGAWPSAPLAAVTTAADGTYSEAALPCGTYAVKAVKDGYVAAFAGGATIDAATPIPVLRAATSVVSLPLSAVPATPSTISGAVTQNGFAYVNCSVLIYKQNADGTWGSMLPQYAYNWLFTGAGGVYTSGPLPIGTYAVRFFGSHLQEWYLDSSTLEGATLLQVTYPGQSYAGVNGTL